MSTSAIPSDIWSDISFWSFYHTFANKFIYYLTGALGLMFFVQLLISYCTRRRTSKIVNVASVDDSIDEKKLHKYIVMVETALKSGASHVRDSAVYLKLIGTISKSEYFKIDVFSEERFILQSGNTDFLLIKTRDYLGEVIEVQLVASSKKWKPARTEVVKVSTGEKFVVPARVIYSDKKSSPEDGILYSVTKKSFCSSIGESFMQYHHWLSFLGPERSGVFTPMVRIILFFLGLSGLMVVTLVVYILIGPPAASTIEIDLKTLVWTCITAALTFLSVEFFEIILRNIKSGYLPEVKQIKKDMYENEKKPKRLCPLYDSLQLKKYNFDSEDPIENKPSEDLEVFHSAISYRSKNSSSKDFKQSGAGQKGGTHSKTSDKYKILGQESTFLSHDDVHLNTTYIQKPSNSTFQHNNEETTLNRYSQIEDRKDSESMLFMDPISWSDIPMQGRFYSIEQMLHMSSVQGSNQASSLNKTIDSDTSKIIEREESEQIDDKVSERRQNSVDKNSDIDCFKDVVSQDLAPSPKSMSKSFKTSNHRKTDLSTTVTTPLSQKQEQSKLLSGDESRAISSLVMVNMEDFENKKSEGNEPENINREESELSFYDPISMSDVGTPAKSHNINKKSKKKKSVKKQDVKNTNMFTSVSEEAVFAKEVFHSASEITRPEIFHSLMCIADLKHTRPLPSENPPEEVFVVSEEYVDPSNEIRHGLQKVLIKLGFFQNGQDKRDVEHCLQFKLKLLIINIAKTLKHLQMRIHCGDTTLFNGLELVVQKWCEILKEETYKLFLTLAFHHGITKDALSQNLNLLPKLIDPIAVDCPNYIIIIIEKCHEKLTSQTRLGYPDIEELSCLILVKLYNMVDDLVDKVLHPARSFKTMHRDVIQEAEHPRSLTSKIICSAEEMDKEVLQESEHGQHSKNLMSETAQEMDKEILQEAEHPDSLISETSSHKKTEAKSSDSSDAFDGYSEIVLNHDSKPVSPSLVSLDGTQIPDVEEKFDPPAEKSYSIGAASVDSEGFVKYLTQQASKHLLSPPEYQVLVTLAAYVVKLAFRNHHWFTQDDWKKLTDEPSPEYLNKFFKQQQKELLIVWKLCSDAKDAAQDEAFEDLSDPSFVYTQYLIRQLVISSLGKKTNNASIGKECQQLKSSLFKHWRKQGFNMKLKSSQYLSEILLSRTITSIIQSTDSNVMSEIFSNKNIVQRILNTLAREIPIKAKQHLLHRGGKLSFLLTSQLKDLFASDALLFEHTDVMVDMTIDETLQCMDKLTKSVVTKELIEFRANSNWKVEMAIDEALQSMDKLTKSVVTKELMESRAELVLSTRDSKTSKQHVRFEEEDKQRSEVKAKVDKGASFVELKTSEIKSIEPDLLNIKQDIMKEMEDHTIDPEQYAQKMEKKHGDFVVVNLQNVFDAAYIRDDNEIDRSLTRELLYELEWDITGENRKCIPHVMKGFLLFILFWGIVLGLVYVTFIGGQLMVDQIKAWCVYWLISVALLGFGFLPLLSVLVGIVTYLVHLAQRVM